MSRNIVVIGRAFSTSLRQLQKRGPAIAEVYVNLFAHPCFDPIRKHIPTTFEDMDPYTVSRKIGESVKASTSLSKEQSALIHNKLIEDLSQYDYGIASIHSRKLRNIEQSITRAALLSMLKNNPGRVSSSWELFVEHMGIYDELPDEVLVTVLNKVVYFDPADIKDGKKSLNLSDVVHAVLLLNKIQTSKIVASDIINKLVSSCIELKATFLLPYIFEYKPSIDLFMEKLDELTPYQLYLVGDIFPFENICAYKQLLYKLVDTLGKNEKILISEEEEVTNKDIAECLALIKKQLPTSWDISVNSMKSIDTFETFGELLDEIAAVEVYKSDLELAKQILRIIGVFKNDTKSFMELYHICVSAHPGKEEELFFEAFLSLTYQGYKTANETALQFAEAYIPETTDEVLKAKILCVQILANAKFNADESLRIYNDNIHLLSKTKDEKSNLSPVDVVTESLIIAYLANRDLEFARVIFEGATRGKLLSGATATKNIKNTLAMYGDAVENGDVDVLMEDTVKSYLQNI